jgi:hypothetical protein
MTDREESGQDECSYVADSSSGSTKALCPIEAIEHKFVKRYILANDSVLETGARYGTTSCEIAAKQNNSGLLISVEPDENVWSSLLQNRHSHRCNFWLVKGNIADRHVDVIQNSYGTRSTPKNETSEEVVKRTSQHGHSSFNFEDIQVITGVKLTALLIDCEGCIETLFNTNSVQDNSPARLAPLLRHVKTILLEGDMPVGARDCTFNCVNYTTWEHNFNAIGLKTTVKEQDGRYPWIIHYVFQR